MKTQKYSLIIASFFILSSCSSIQPNQVERYPSSLLSDCKNAISSFLGNKKSDEVAKVEGKSSANIDRDYVTKNHKENTFTTGRGLNHYRSSFNRRGYPILTFTQELEKIKSNPNGHWLDAGGGMGFATQEAITPGSKFKSTLVSVETPAEDIFDSSTGELRRKVIKGKFIEDIADDEIEKSDLITDMYGPLAYSSHPDQVIRKYINNLKQDGVIYIHLGDDLDTFGFYDQVVTPDGKVLTLSEWLESIPGLKVDIVKTHGLMPDTTIISGEKSRIARITLSKPADEISIPELERMSFTEGGSMDGFIVPRMIFKAKFPTSAPVNPNNKKVVNNLRKMITDFRTGEYEHPLFDQLSGVKSEEWAHFSNQPIDWSGLDKIDISDDSHYTTGKVIGKAKSLAEKNMQAKATSISDLKAQKFKLISDHNGTFVSEGSPDQVLQTYINSLTNKGKIVLFMGDDKQDLSRMKILTPGGGYINFKSWLSKIKGIKVSFKTSKETVQVTGKKLKADPHNVELLPTGPTEDFIDRKVLYHEVVVIEVSDPSKVEIPKLHLIGKAPTNERGFQVPMYMAE